MPLPIGVMDGFVARLKPVADETIKRLAEAEFKEDPLVAKRYSRATSITSSAYKRHIHILRLSLLERLKDCARLRVWREDGFKLSTASLQSYRFIRDPEACLRIEHEYGEAERVIPLDIVVHDTRARTLRAYSMRRGHGQYDAKKKNVMAEDIIRTSMMLKGYAKTIGVADAATEAKIIFYYGVRSIPVPYSLVGDELDDHFRFPVHASIEAVNAYFSERLSELIEVA
jgi:hypothetical protein